MGAVIYQTESVEMFCIFAKDPIVNCCNIVVEITEIILLLNEQLTA